MCEVCWRSQRKSLDYSSCQSHVKTKKVFSRRQERGMVSAHSTCSDHGDAEVCSQISVTEWCRQFQTGRRRSEVKKGIPPECRSKILLGSWFVLKWFGEVEEWRTWAVPSCCNGWSTTWVRLSIFCLSFFEDMICTIEPDSVLELNLIANLNEPNLEFTVDTRREKNF